MILRAPGTNCDVELARAFTLAGAQTEIWHLDALIKDPALLDKFDLFGLAGGFSYGDDVASGRIYALKLRQHLYPALREAAMRGCPMYAVCNGFQIAVQAGLLPGPTDGHWPEQPAEAESVLAHNAGGRFIDRWVPVHAVPESVCIWTRGLADRFAPEAMILPIAHGEGRFVPSSESVLNRLRATGQIALRYGSIPVPSGQLHPDNPNGSTDNIVGICDPSGRIFGLMPHPERYLDWNRHPAFTRLSPQIKRGATPGEVMFRNALEVAPVRVVPTTAVRTTIKA